GKSERLEIRDLRPLAEEECRQPESDGKDRRRAVRAPKPKPCDRRISVRRRQQSRRPDDRREEREGGDLGGVMGEETHLGTRCGDEILTQEREPKAETFGRKEGKEKQRTKNPDDVVDLPAHPRAEIRDHPLRGDEGSTENVGNTASHSRVIREE